MRSLMLAACKGVSLWSSRLHLQRGWTERWEGRHHIAYSYSTVVGREDGGRRVPRGGWGVLEDLVTKIADLLEGRLTEYGSGCL